MGDRGQTNEIRRNEVAVEAPAPTDAGLVFIGIIRTPEPRGWRPRAWAATTGRSAGSKSTSRGSSLDGLERFERIEVLYWLHQSRRDLVRQSPANDGTTFGTFALRTPARPYPIGTSIARLFSRDGAG